MANHEMNVTDETFAAEVLNCPGIVLVDFWASWCPPCKMMQPMIADFAEEFEHRVKVCTLNIDQNAQLAGRYEITNVPTFIAFADGRETARGSGAKTKNQLLALVAVAESGRAAA